MSGEDGDMRMQMKFLIVACIGICTSAAAAAPSGYLDHFELSGKKVRVHLDKQRIPGAGPQSVELAYLVDESCLAKRPAIPASLGDIQLPIPAAPGKRSPVQTYKIVNAPGIAPSLDWVEQDPCVLGVANNRPAFADELPNDPLLARQPPLSTIQYLPAYPFFSDSASGRESVIAIIDTGIDLAHDDLRANLWVNPAEANGKKGVDDDGNGFVDDVHGYNFASESGDPSHETANDHGTHVAGLAAAVSGNQLGVVGVAGARARLMVLNVFGKNWGTETVYIDKAI